MFKTAVCVVLEGTMQQYEQTVILVGTLFSELAFERGLKCKRPEDFNCQRLAESYTVGYYL